MSGACDPANQIPSYTDIFSLDCVSLETDLLDTETLVINGVPFTPTSLNGLLTVTQNQTAIVSPPSTSFVGSFNAGSVVSNGGNLSTATYFTNNVGSTTVLGNVTFTGALTTGSTVNVLSTITFGTTLISAFQASLAVSNSVNLFLGVANSTNNGSTHQFNYLALGSATNNMITKVVGGTAQVQLTGTSSVITGNLFIGTLGCNPRVAFTPQDATTQNDIAFTWVGTANVCRAELSIRGLQRNVGTSKTYIQLGTSPSTWHTATYAGQSFNWFDPALTTYWAPGFTGLPLMDTETWGTASVPRSWYGRIEFTYMGKQGTQEVWGVSGMITNPEIFSTIGPFGQQYTGHFKAPANQTINMVRLVLATGTETFRDGDVTLATE